MSNTTEIPITSAITCMKSTPAGLSVPDEDTDALIGDDGEYLLGKDGEFLFGDSD